MKSLLLGFAAVPVVGAVSYYLMKKPSKTPDTTSTKKPYLENIFEFYNTINLTPHAINIYDINYNLIHGIKPADKSMQLRLVSSKAAPPEKKFLISSLNNEVDETNMHKQYQKGDRESVPVYVKEDEIKKRSIIHGVTPVKSPVTYDGIEGLENLRDKVKCSNFNAIIVSPMVAEFMTEHAKDYSDLHLDVFAPDTEKSAEVRDTEGVLKGITGVVHYGKLE